MNTTNGDTMAQRAVVNCCFSYPGTYGHECGKPATVVFVKPSDNTKSGLFYSGRCAACAKETCGRDNWGVIRREPVGDQKNEWK